MRSRRNSVLAAASAILVFASFVVAQVPTQTKLKFAIDVPYELKIGGYALPAGHYVLMENSRNSNLFALYSRDMTREPIAMIQTTRVRHWAVQDDRDTRIMLNIDESTRDSRPVLVGWNVPYADAWEIVSVVAKKEGSLARAYVSL